jgi:DNA mismatch endonuclease (patch repair protein)
MIKGKNTKPEMLVRTFLHANGYRYKLHDKKLPGKPDIVLPKYRIVIFVVPNPLPMGHTGQ